MKLLLMASILIFCTGCVTNPEIEEINANLEQINQSLIDIKAEMEGKSITHKHPRTKKKSTNLEPENDRLEIPANVLLYHLRGR